MDTFEELLKKNCFRCHFKELEKWCKEPNPEVLPVRALGEWHIEEYLRIQKVCKEDCTPKGASYFMLLLDDLKKKAIVCLEKKEVERRLKEAGK